MKFIKSWLADELKVNYQTGDPGHCYRTLKLVVEALVFGSY